MIQVDGINFGELPAEGCIIYIVQRECVARAQDEELGPYNKFKEVNQDTYLYGRCAFFSSSSTTPNRKAN